MSILKENLAIESMEKKMDWYGAFHFCREAWKSDKHNLDISLRFITETWYLLSYWEQIPHLKNGERVFWPRCEDADYNILQPELRECLDECDSLNIDNPLYLCITGYIMQVQPEWFVNHSNWDTIYEEGRKRLSSPQLKNNMETLLFQNILLNHVTTPKSDIKFLFPGNSEVDLHFRSLLTYYSQLNL